MANPRAVLRRWHVWLGWVVALPMLFWTVSGLIMVWRPIEEVRGEHLLAPTQPVVLTSQPIPPRVEGVPLSGLSLEQRASGPRWIVQLPNGRTRLADPGNGALLPPLSAADAGSELLARYAGESEIASTSRIDPERPPLDYRRDAPAWQVRMTDGTHFYVDAGSGEIVARRTPWWRFYDLMWGLHIMDLDTREDTHNARVVGFGIVSLVMTLLAFVLLLLTARWRRKTPRRPVSPS